MKIKLLAALLLITSISYSQFSPGRLIVGGQGSYYSSKQGTGLNSIKIENFSVEPLLLMQIDSSVSVGLSGGYVKKDEGNRNTEEWKAGPVVRIQQRWKERVSFYFQLGAFYMKGTGRTNSNYYDNFGDNYIIVVNQQYSGLSAQLLPGINYGLSRRFFLDMTYGSLTYEMLDMETMSSLNYTGYPQSSPVFKDNINTLSIDLGLKSIRVGAVYMF